MNAFNKCAKEAKVPTFGYDANTDVVAGIKDGFESVYNNINIIKLIFQEVNGQKYKKKQKI